MAFTHEELSAKVAELYLSGETNVVTSTNGDPLTTMILTGSTIDEAAKNPKAIARLMIDMVYSEGKNPEGCALYFEHRDNKRRVLKQWETGCEPHMTGGWVRVVTAAHVYQREKAGIKQQIRIGRAVDHGVYRGCRMVEFR